MEGSTHVLPRREQMLRFVLTTLEGQGRLASSVVLVAKTKTQTQRILSEVPYLTTRITGYYLVMESKLPSQKHFVKEEYL